MVRPLYADGGRLNGFSKYTPPTEPLSEKVSGTVPTGLVPREHHRFPDQTTPLAVLVPKKKTDCTQTHTYPFI